MAARILIAWNQGHGVVSELYYAKTLNASPADTLEMEKMEILEGAVESLGSPRQARVRAALQLLKNLAEPEPLLP